MNLRYRFSEIVSIKKSDVGIRTSLENFGRVGNVNIFPLYAIENLFVNK